jgi:sigma-B regulation protein RsbU (phosphoserine phosphatase)
MTRPAARRNSLELERQRDLLRRQQERDQRVLSALYNISLACRERPDFRAIFESIHRELATVFTFDAAYIAFCDERPEYFKCAYLVDEGQSEYMEHVEFGFLSGAIVHAGQPRLYRDLVYERDPSQPRVPFGNTERRSRSWLGVPLMIGSQSVGVVSIQSYEVGLYDESHQDLLQRMANVIAVALENVALIERQGSLSAALAAQVAVRTAEIASLSGIAATLVERRPLPELLDDAIKVALALFSLDAGNVRLLDEAGENLVLQAAQGFPSAYTTNSIRSRLAVSPIREVVEQNHLQVTEQGWHTRVDRSRPPFDTFPPFESSLSLPLSIGEVVKGTLTLFGLAPRSFDDHEIRLAQAVANQIAIVVENTRLLDERERQIGELRALSEVSAAASTAQDLRALLGQVHDALKTFLPIDVFSMVVYDPERSVVIEGLTIDQGQVYEYWSNQPPPPDSLTAHILRTGASLRFGDLPTDILAYPAIELTVTGAERHARSWLGVPLHDRDGRTIGQINVQGYTPQVFSARDEHFLQNVAAQVALHVQNVRLLAQRERQIAELEAIGQIGKVVTASFNLDKMLAEIYRIFSELTGASVFALLVCEPESSVITNAVFVEEGEWISLDLVGHTVTPGSMSDWILTHREPLLFHDLVEHRHEMLRRGIEPRAVGPENPVRSWAGVPVVARDGELIGVLSIQDYRAYRYDSQTIDFLSQVASHISLGVQKVRLFDERDNLIATAQAHAEAAERQAHRMELVHRIASVLSARLDQQEILEIAARELVQLFWADHTGTVLMDSNESGTLVAEYPDTGIVGMRLDLHDNPIVARIIQTRRPVIITDLENDPLAEQSRELWRSLGIQSLAIVPLVSRDRVYGTISLDSYSGPLVFSDDELELMQTVATSIAAAVENAQLFAAEQEQRRTADTLREVARVLSSSFDPDEVLRLVLGELHKLIPYDTASIMLLDGLQLRMVAARGASAETEPRSIILPLEGSGAGEVVRRREALLYVAEQGELRWMRLPTSSNIHSWLGVPLIARDRVLGVLNIDSRVMPDASAPPPRTFTERDVEVARTFANHAALAIENSRLYQESVTRVEQELEIARRIQSNLFPRQLPAVEGITLAARCLPARETGGDFYDVIDLGARMGVIVGDVSGKSLPAAMLMAVSRSTSRSEARNHETPWVVLTETNRWLVDDVPHNSFVALSYALIDPEQKRLVLASGGQLSPLLRRADGSTAFLESPSSLPLGMQLDVKFTQVETELASGDTLLFYTDGIVEAHDQCRALFGFERLEHILQRWGHLDPAELIDRVLAEVHAFSEGAPTHDDMTLVVVRVA